MNCAFVAIETVPVFCIIWCAQMEGLVIEAGEEWVQVYVPKYGIEKRA